MTIYHCPCCGFLYEFGSLVLFHILSAHPGKQLPRVEELTLTK